MTPKFVLKPDTVCHFNGLTFNTNSSSSFP